MVEVVPQYMQEGEMELVLTRIYEGQALTSRMRFPAEQVRNGPGEMLEQAVNKLDDYIDAYIDSHFKLEKPK